MDGYESTGTAIGVSKGAGMASKSEEIGFGRVLEKTGDENELQGLVEMIKIAKQRIRLSQLDRYQQQYLDTSLSSLQVLINSLESEYGKSFPGDVYATLRSLIMKFEVMAGPSHSTSSSPIAGRSRFLRSNPSRAIPPKSTPSRSINGTEIIDESTHHFDTSNHEASRFSTPIRNSFSRSSSISKATITKENVTSEPIHIDGTVFRRFTTPGIDNHFRHSISEVLRMSSPVKRNDYDYSKSFDSNNVFLD